MSPDVRHLKQVAAKLSADELNHLIGWCYRLAQTKEREIRSDSESGIYHGLLLKSFRKFVPISGNGVKLVFASLAATALMDFYEKVRVRGCRFEKDADMLLVEWGFDGKEPFLSFTRQLIPPKAEGKIWQLTLHYRYKPSDAPKGLTAGNRWCHSLKQLDAFTAFIYTSRNVSYLSKKTHIGHTLTYQNIE